MSMLAHLFGIMPFSLDVGGRKTKWVLRIGDALISSNNQRHFKLSQHALSLPPKHLLRIWNYAPININRTYKSSELWQYILSHLASDARFIDIGSNIGGYLKLANERGMTTLGVEANPELGQVLAQNREVFGEVHSLALGDEDGVQPFHISDINPGGSSLVESNKGWMSSGYNRTVDVNVTTLDGLLHSKWPDWEVVDLVKIDVEGAEESVVRGMKKSLASGKIRAIWCEVRGPESDRNPNSALTVNRFLADFGFEAFTFNSSQNPPLCPFDPGASLPQYFDLLFVRSESVTGGRDA